MKIGDRVEKTKGYRWPGVVVSMFETLNGQERIVVHCAVVAGGGKTVGWDKEKGAFKRAPTASIERAAFGMTVANIPAAATASAANSSATTRRRRSPSW